MTIQTTPLVAGDKIFNIRNKAPYQLMDYAVKEFKRLSAIEDEDDRLEASFPVRDKVFMKMCVDPKITEEYLANEADVDDYEAANRVMEIFGKMLDNRFAETKKAPPSSSE